MADFVAVIRRAVDGLSDNSPEMRAKVYEKARGAVRRQLESMNPVPSEAMINRQIDKLENAINEVEIEHSEALPPEDLPLEDQPPENVPEEIVAPAPEPVDEPAAEITEIPPEVAEPYQAPEDPVAEPYEAIGEAEGEPEQAPLVQAYEEPTQAAAEELHQLPSEETAEPVYDEPQPEPASENAEQAGSDEEPTPLGLHAVEPHDADAYARDELLEEAEFLQRRDDVAAPAETWEPEAEPVQEEAAHSEPEPAAETEADEEPVDLLAPDDEHRPFASYPGNEGIDSDTPPADQPAEEKPRQPVWDLSDWNRQEPALPADDQVIVEPHAKDQSLDAGNSVVDGGERDAPRSTWNWDADPFDTPKRDPQASSAELPRVADTWSWPVEKQEEPAVEPETQRSSAWGELEDLIGYEKPVAGAQSDPAAEQPVIAAEPVVAAKPQATQFKVDQPRRGINVLPIVLGLILLLLLGGGGYAYWQTRDTVNAWFASVVSSVMPAETPETGTETAPGTETATPEDATTPADTAGTDVAAVATDSTKFTQRLQTDGTEIDPGPAATLEGDGTVEGTTVTAQTDAGAPIGDTPATTTTTGDAGTTPPLTTPEQTVPTDETSQADAIPAGTGEKMFLYEERLGQTSPTAIEGTIAWSVKEESPGGDARPEPVIQGQITVPDRSLTALMTIKRNADPSLPASHIIEFVFSLPETFEGGSIENVQRVAMKRNEQDRGDPLIAVPAKITDDFHMIALNDFQEAIASNTELLRSRPWIDIPITYRNGRRALITIEKGTTGTEVFNTVMQGWANTAATPASGQ